MSVHIGIAGPLASGKSTLARILKEHLEVRGYTVAIVPMAKAMKELVASIPGGGLIWTMLFASAEFMRFGYDQDAAMQAGAAFAQAYQEHYTPNEKPRKLLQIVGTEIGREMLDEDIWVKRVQAEIEHLNVDVVITDDIRFNNEALAVDFLIKIVSDSPIARAAYERNRLKFSEQYLDTNHASEHGLTVVSDFDVPCGFKEDGIDHLVERVIAWLPAS